MASPSTVILGGGIHAISLAYFLAREGAPVTVVERSALGCAASGKAGGFLARNWGDRHTSGLHEQGFELHASLAAELDLQSYRRIPTISVSPGRKAKRGAKVPGQWVDTAAASMMDSETAQVTPREYCDKVWARAEEMGAQLVIGKAVGVEMEAGRVTALRIDGHGEALACDTLVVAAGPWSGPIMEDWFGVRLPMVGIKSTSMVFEALPEIRDDPAAAFCGEVGAPLRID
eukprot:scaffold178_cov255-Pinguiococcus_pyrenoidosus.AAC.22